MVKNKFKNIIGKKSTGIITTILSFVVILGAIFANSNLTIAADSLPGIESIRNEITDANAPYRILEIVPNREVPCCKPVFFTVPLMSLKLAEM